MSRFMSSMPVRHFAHDGPVPRLPFSPPIYPHSLVKPPSNYDATKYRKWVQLGSSENPRLTVMSYNLLSQHYVWKQVYENANQKYLDWPHYRFPLINETVKQLPCDIMCFQELECLVYHNSWQHSFPLENYELFYVQKPNPAYWENKPTEFMDGVGIFVNTKRFEVLRHQEINFGQYVEFHSSRFDITNDIATRLVPRNTVALLLELRDRITGKNVYVSNTHLYWLPKYNDVKLLQTKILLNLLNRFIAESSPTEKPHIIMCGDFNSTPDLLVCKLLKEGEINMSASPEFDGYDYGSKIDGESLSTKVVKNPFFLTSTYGPLLYAENSDKLDFTSHTVGLTEVLDHVWCSNKFETCRVLGKVDSDYSEHSIGFPDEQFPSDHIPLVSEIAYA